MDKDVHTRTIRIKEIHHKFSKSPQPNIQIHCMVQIDGTHATNKALGHTFYVMDLQPTFFGEKHTRAYIYGFNPQ